MRPYVFYVRLALIAALVLTSVACAGWKWLPASH
jgi:hypothetical protein